MDEGELYDPATRERVRATTDRSYRVAFMATAIVISGLVGGLHYEEAPFLAYLLSYCDGGLPSYQCEYPPALDWAAGVLTLAVVAPALALLLRQRRIAPTLSCNRCGGRGWILDLEATAGCCPRCGHDRFRYFGLIGTGVPVVRIQRDADVLGSDLLAARGEAGLL